MTPSPSLKQGEGVNSNQKPDSNAEIAKTQQNFNKHPNRSGKPIVSTPSAKLKTSGKEKKSGKESCKNLIIPNTPEEKMIHRINLNQKKASTHQPHGDKLKPQTDEAKLDSLKKSGVSTQAPSSNNQTNPRNKIPEKQHTPIQNHIIKALLTPQNKSKAMKTKTHAFNTQLANQLKSASIMVPGKSRASQVQQVKLQKQNSISTKIYTADSQ